MPVRREKHRDAAGVVREYWMVEVNFKHSDGRTERVRRRSPVQTRRGAEEYERQIRTALLDGTFENKEEKPEQLSAPTIPRVSEFMDEFLRTYVDVNNKPSECKTKRIILDQHIKPRLGRLLLNEVAAHIEPFKADLLGWTQAAVRRLAEAGIVARERVEACSAACRGLIVIATLDFLYDDKALGQDLARQHVNDLLRGFGRDHGCSEVKVE